MVIRFKLFSHVDFFEKSHHRHLEETPDNSVGELIPIAMSLIRMNVYISLSYGKCISLMTFFVGTSFLKK